jgi:pyruvate,water dikinase
MIWSYASKRPRNNRCSRWTSVPAGSFFKEEARNQAEGNAMALSDWLLNDKPSQRFPIYTRSNASEVMGAPLSPLGWGIVWRAAFEPGTLEGYIATGGFERDEILFEAGETYGAFGGYFFLNLSMMLILVDRMGGDAEQLAAAFDSHPAMPKYQRQDWYLNPVCTQRLADWQRDVLAGVTPEKLSPLQAESFEARARRPDLSSLSAADLVRRARDMQPLIHRGGEMHVTTGVAGLVAQGALQVALAGIGRSEDISRLCATGKEVETADIATKLWEISRIVRATPALAHAFEAGVDGLLDRIDDARFRAMFEEFLRLHGSRGDNEWDLLGRTFETTPANALSLVASMTKQGDQADPALAQDRNRRVQAETLAAIQAQVSDETYQQIKTAAETVMIWFSLRENSKNQCIRFVHEIRMVCEELAKRAIARGDIDSIDEFYMLTDDELEAFAADSTTFKAELKRRLDVFREVSSREPPFIVNGAYDPADTWPKRMAEDAVAAEVGETLQGLGCSPGRVEGRARIILDASDPGALEPGDILITRTTNPSWTPLFLVAGGVITELGLFNSHASIVSRELGVPCIVSVPGAVGRIPDGALISMDGDTGVVEILEDVSADRPVAAAMN